MAQLPVFSEAQEYYLLLEKERYGVKTTKTETVEVVAPCKLEHNPKCNRKHITESRDQMMFNAGRFAAGAVDKIAADAHKKLMSVLGDE